MCGCGKGEGKRKDKRNEEHGGIAREIGRELEGLSTT